MTKFNVYLRKDGRWEGRISKEKSADGRRHFRYFFGRTKEDVVRRMIAAKKEEAGARCEYCFSELCSEWINSVHTSVKDSTYSNYIMKIEKHILPYFGSMKADEITEKMIYAFISSKQKKGLSNRYISDILVLLKSVFKRAVLKYRILNPMEGISMPKRKQPVIRLLDNDEQSSLTSYISDNRNLTTLGVALAMTTGIRIGELCALQWKDIDLKKRTLTVRKTMQRIQMKNGDKKTKLVITDPKSDSSKRCIPLTKSIVDFLSEFKGESDEFLLSGTKKAVEPRTMQYRFNAILKNVHLPSVHFHALRHIFASYCVKLGFDIKSLSELLGHSSVEITMNRYVHSSFELKQAYMERIMLSF